MPVDMMDFFRLVHNPSADVRSQVAAKVAITLFQGGFNAHEMPVALEIVRLMVKDAAVQVRRVLAEHLKHCPAAPREAVLKLAYDETDIALPLLEFSMLLGEQDLLDIIKSTREVARLVAIARRERVPEMVSEALIATHELEVMHSLLGNPGAHLREQALLKEWDMIAGSGRLLETLVHRGGLSPDIVEKLYGAVSEELKLRLVETYRLNPDVSESSVEEQREWMTLGMLSADGEQREFNDQELERLVAQLHRNGRLTHTIIMRSLCLGDIAFFETAMARLADLPRGNARLLMFDSGPLGFKAFYTRVGMPEHFYDAIRILLKISLEETGYGRFRREDFRRRVVERVRARGYDASIENMQYLLTIIGEKRAAAHTFH